MARIISKLNLNKTPQLVESNSMIFAKNIKLLKDGSLGQDNSITRLPFNDNVVRADIQTRINESNSKIEDWLAQIDKLQSNEVEVSLLDCYIDFVTNRNFCSDENIYSSWSYSGGSEASTATFMLVDNSNLANYIEHNGQNISKVKVLAWFENINHTGHTELKFPLFPKKLFEYVRNVAINGPGNYWFSNFDYATFADTLYGAYQKAKDDQDTATIALIEDNFEVFPYVSENQTLNEVYHVNYDGGATNKYFYCAVYAWMISYFLIHHSSELNKIIIEAKQNSKADDNVVYSQIALLNNYVKKERDKVNSYEQYLETISNIEDYDIVGVIPYNTEFYLFLYKPEKIEDNVTAPADSIIVKYKEDVGFTICPCNWNYSGGEIDGQCFVNLNGDTLLNICEYKEDNTLLVPIKTINLNDATKNDDESFYTQIPRINFINLSFLNYYNKPIPNGVYQFFIRYKINKNFYTNWFPASKELYAGTIRRTNLAQGPLQYVDTTIDSVRSFHLSVDKLKFDEALAYQSFQVGFICSHDDTIYAKAWKEFDFGVNDIYFDCDTEYLEDIAVEDLLENSYGLFNVKNLTTFKNKLYVSNYIESDFNPDISSQIDVTIGLQTIQPTDTNDYYYNYPIELQTVDGVKYIRTIDDKTIASIIHNNVFALKDYYKYGTSIQNKEVSYKGVKLKVSRDSGRTYVHDSKYLLQVGHFGAETSYESDDIDSLLDMIVAEYDNVDVNSNFYSGVGVASLPVKLFVFHHDNETIYNFEFSIVPQNVVEHISELKVDMPTLMPGQEYAFYVHFVKDTGEYTNGYYIGSLANELAFTTLDYDNIVNNHPILYPTFTFNNPIPKGYVGCFITMQHTKNYISEIFNIQNDTYGDNTNQIIGDNLDLDTRQYSDIYGLDVVKPNSANIKGEYHASYDNTVLRYFGGSGKVLLDGQPAHVHGGGTVNDTNAFIKMPYESNSKYREMIRLTPYIIYDEANYTYDNYEDLNLQSFVCTIYKPYNNLDIYVAGNDVYKKGSNYTSGDNVLVEFNDLSEWNDSISVDINDIHSNTIYSNFNLNYLSLVVDDSVINLVPQIVTKEFNNTPDRRLLTLAQSMTLSEVYELKSMYKSYTRKMYMPYTDDAITTFDNTIRSSTLNGDEAKINIFKFRTVDYYNVPTDKGIIVNLVAIGDAILVHTQDSMYKFTGSNSLSAAGGEDVAMKEGEPFDTGIQEIFGSEFGFAGLQIKHQHTITENGYAFFDWDAKMLYIYGGEGKLNPVSDAIEKLLKRNKLIDVIFANDYYNDRIFIQLLYEDAFATLSFNFKAKSFISLHDFTFTKSFHTKTKCYFLKNNKLYRITSAVGSYGDLVDSDKLYPYLDGYTFNIRGRVWDSNSKCSIIDVVFNQDYENVKTLNSIDWICNLIEDFAHTDELKFKLVAEEKLKPIAGCFMRIYSDSTTTDLIDIENVSNKYALANYSDGWQLTEEQRNIYPNVKRNRVNINSYQFPRFNLGKWNFNYFRNILNIHDPSTTPSVNRDTPSVSDNRSLIYGKYIVVRFVFNAGDNFKLESVDFNIARY